MAGITPTNQVPLMPTYTDTATVETLPMPTYTFTTGKATRTISAGDGWLDAQDTQGGQTAIAGCTYPDPWNAASGVALPTAPCPDTAPIAPATIAPATIAPVTIAPATTAPAPAAPAAPATTAPAPTAPARTAPVTSAPATTSLTAPR